LSAPRCAFLIFSDVPETSEPEERGLKQLQIKERPEVLPPKATPEIFISYAWGDNSSEDARKRGEVVEQLYFRFRTFKQSL